MSGRKYSLDLSSFPLIYNVRKIIKGSYINKSICKAKYIPQGSLKNLFMNDIVKHCIQALLYVGYLVCNVIRTEWLLEIERLEKKQNA
ncbi:MAG: hypothetical protein B6241_06735 [Spirochaetaceae bacterium 4572_59]|nr:MAG: hypothetical protein B6241_06735 [Spirochaetaceae bacterium 4572_59]